MFFSGCRIEMYNYIIQFHKGTAKESNLVLEVQCKADSDIPASMYRKALEESLKDLDFSFTICRREGYSADDYEEKYPKRC